MKHMVVELSLKSKTLLESEMKKKKKKRKEIHFENWF